MVDSYYTPVFLLVAFDRVVALQIDRDNDIKGENMQFRSTLVFNNSEKSNILYIHLKGFTQGVSLAQNSLSRLWSAQSNMILYSIMFNIVAVREN